MTRRLMITVDVEAQPARAERDHVERLVWGRYPEGRGGLGEMMDMAERHGVRLVTFLDFCEEYLYGEEMTGVAREIVRRGHDLQLHSHPEFLPRTFWAERELAVPSGMSRATDAQADALFEFLCGRYRDVAGHDPGGYRGGGYVYGPAVLRAMARHDVRLDSSYVSGRPTQPLARGPLKQFRWDTGCLELPISSVNPFLNLRRDFDFNFSAEVLHDVERMVACLEAFYAQQGDEAVAVMVMHSWSFSRLRDDGRFSSPLPERLERFDGFLDALAGEVEVVTTPDLLALADGGDVALGPDLAVVELERELGLPETKASSGPVAGGGCPICGAPAESLADFNGRARARCAECGGVERQRVLATVYDDLLSEELDLRGKAVLGVSLDAAERRFLVDRGAGEIRSLDIRPETRPDIVADVCAMPEIPAASFDCAVASYVLTCVHDLDAALAELHRVLRPGGWLLTSDPLRFGEPSVEHADEATIARWYGRDVLERYRVGTFRQLGDLDLLDRLTRWFVPKTLYGRDPVTRTKVVWHAAVRRDDVAAPSPDRSPLAEVVEAAGSLVVAACPVCGDALDETEGGNCRGCASRPRTRSLAPVVERVVAPLLAEPGLRDRPLLAFAMTTAEQRLLRDSFPTIASVSLFGSYRDGHESGVDVRDLSRYEPGSASGLFGCLLFDYVPELDRAFAEAARVLAPGGLLFTHVSGARLRDDGTPPVVRSTIEPRAGYFEYVPSEEGLPSIEVGREWVVEALARAGLDAARVTVRDRASAETLDWFVARKPDGAVPPAPAVPAAAPRRDPPRGPVSAERTYSIDVDPAFGFGRVEVELSVPVLPAGAERAEFAEHVWSSHAGASTDQVIACAAGVIAVSEDLGATWRSIPTPETGDVRLWNCFTTSAGNHLVQGAAPPAGEPADHPDRQAPIFVFDRDWDLVDRVQPAQSPWHGSRSIDEAGGVIMYGEYPGNFARDRSAAAAGDADGLALPMRVLRSRDQGRSWEVVLEQSWRDVRHFHTVVADPYRPGRWWASSGDTPSECRVWESLDDGDSWRDVTPTDIDVALPPERARHAQSVMRYTDIVVGADEVIWGSDDWLGDPAGWRAADGPPERRPGARIFRSARDTPWRPEAVGLVGNPVRSIVAVDESYIVLTEAKQPAAGLTPQALLLSAREPTLLAPLFELDNHADAGTGLTYSRASRSARDGVFFTYRGTRDAFDGGPRILRWRVSPGR